MKDEILKNFLDDFSKNHGIEDLGEDEKFEKFVNFNIVSQLYPRDIEIDDLSVGGQGDTAIDGIAIIVNGSIIKAEEDIDSLIRKNGSLDITFVFIQSKNQSKFKGDAIGNFIFGVKCFFEDQAILKENEYIKSLRRLKEKIYKHSIDFSRNPELKLFFVTTGEWKEPEDILARANYEFSFFKEKNLFINSDPNEFIKFIDANRLKDIYREISRRAVKEVLFDNCVALPDMSSEVKQSFVGSILANNFIKLIEDSEGNISKGLFFDNVRDYQGKNKVNKEIENTLKSDQHQNLLPLLNNGITIIAQKLDRVGQKIKLTNFQIVNGCQTSHVLFENRNYLSDNTHLIIKIIETTNQDTINRIIQATNSQTEVKDEAFEALKPFHKELSEYYRAKNKELSSIGIYYERRSKEYINDINIKPYQVITLSSQIKSYVSTVLEQPQSTHRYFGELLDSNLEKNRIFNDKNLETIPLYYLSSLLLNKLEFMLKKGIIFAKYRMYKYHIIFLTYIMLKHLKSKEMSVNEKISFIDDNQKIKKLFIDSCKIIKDTKNEFFVSEQDFNLIRNKEFSIKIKERVS